MKRFRFVRHSVAIQTLVSLLAVRSVARDRAATLTRARFVY